MECPVSPEPLLSVSWTYSNLGFTNLSNCGYKNKTHIISGKFSKPENFVSDYRSLISQNEETWDKGKFTSSDCKSKLINDCHLYSSSSLYYCSWLSLTLPHLLVGSVVLVASVDLGIHLVFTVVDLDTHIHFMVVTHTFMVKTDQVFFSFFIKNRDMCTNNNQSFFVIHIKDLFQIKRDYTLKVFVSQYYPT